MKKQKEETLKANLSLIQNIDIAKNTLQGGDLKSYHPIYINFYVEESNDESEKGPLYFGYRETVQLQFRFHPLDVMHLLLLTDSHFSFSNMHVPKDPYKTPFKTEYRDLDGRLVIHVDDMSKCSEALENLKRRATEELEEAKKVKEKAFKRAEEEEAMVVNRWAQFL